MSSPLPSCFLIDNLVQLCEGKQVFVQVLNYITSDCLMGLCLNWSMGVKETWHVMLIKHVGELGGGFIHFIKQGLNLHVTGVHCSHWISWQISHKRRQHQTKNLIQSHLTVFLTQHCRCKSFSIFTGGPLTVTDANLALGRLLPSFFPKIFGPGENEPLSLEETMKHFRSLTQEINLFLSSNQAQARTVTEL